MDKLVSCFSKYHIMETLIPGFIFIVLIDLLIIDIGEYDFIILTILAYFIGVIISRISSIFTKKFLFKFTKEKGVKYSDYINATKNDEKIEELSMDKNLYRNLVTVCLLLLLTKFTQNIKIVKYIGLDLFIIIILIFLIVLFSISFIKMNSIIIERVNVSKKNK